ncbi:GPI ethanolamine phosphate transferase 1-like [Centruroides vittatus]|uniref:GPI ethanolamine phosphate transferase 1-like n=1 Tax=Centruroides vittatus TaxID=120091 RepID=UPI003510B38B
MSIFFPRSISVMWVTTLGIVIHIIFLSSVFDIYFKSPIIHGLSPHYIPLPPPAKRVVLFVADGLRADKLLELNEKEESRAPYLRDILSSKGAWGISHTRVPTESRPGHVAIAAGFYEDVSAVFKGWKENPVEFDSVFNESRYTWAWGSPDILPMFAKGSKGNHIFINTYDAKEEDFAGADSSKLDTWVFDKFHDFLKHAEQNKTLKHLLSDDQIIFFLHLLGLDTNGHSHKPGSQEYLQNINIVDKGVQQCVKLIEDFYDDDKQTAFIFTSDHGMTEWGSHGAGHPHETLTPLIAWGAGIRGPLGTGKDVYHDGLSEEWKLTYVRRVDVSQADIAPLISILIGAPIPINSVGVLPVEYLSTDWYYKATAIITNVKQILSQYEFKVWEKKYTSLPIFYRHFRDLSSQRQDELLKMIDTLMKQSRYKDAIQVGLKLIELSLKGINYYQKYDRFALNVSIFLAFIGWINYVILLIIKNHTAIIHISLEQQQSVLLAGEYPKLKITLLFLFIGSIVAWLLYEQNSPAMYYIYFLTPVFLWNLIFCRWDLIQQAQIYMERRNYTLKFIGIIIICIVGLELLVASFFRRGLLSLGLIFISLWPLTTSIRYTHKFIAGLWFLTCIIMAIFPFLPVVGRQSNYTLVTFTGWIYALLAAYCARRPELGLIRNSRQKKKESQQVTVITGIQVIILFISIYIMKSTSDSIENKTGLPLLNQMLSWLILGLSFILPIWGSTSILTRLLNVAISFLSLYLLMSITYDALFCLGLCVTMFLWLYIEHLLSGKHYRLQDVSFEVPAINFQTESLFYRMGIDDIRRSYFFIFFIILAFFGTGNIASINSFEPSSVYCFLTVFSPFIMGILLLIKILIPFLIVSCVFRAILVSVKVPPKALLMVILVMTDFMGLHFFFLVQDSGSWLDIGISISHYVIMMSTTIFVMILYGVSWLLTSCSFAFSIPLLKRHLQ